MPGATASTAKKAPLKTRLKKSMPIYALLLPGVLLLFFFHYVPIYGLLIAFKSYRPSRGILGSEWVSLKWFV